MSPRSISRAMIDSLLPPGWDVKQGGDLDLFLEGLAENSEDLREFLSTLSRIRNPQKTSYLSDLEKEFGLMVRENLSEQTRRDRLDVRVYERNSTGSDDNLQTALQRAGFVVQVHENSPAVDPAIFLNQAFQMVAGDPVNAFAGDPFAYAGQIGGELLVNGPIFSQIPLFLMECGDANAFAGDPFAYAGYFLELKRIPVVYEIPTEPGDWPLVFFVGGDATRDIITDELTDIEIAEVPIERKEEFQNIILRYKPTHSWAGLIVIYT